MGRKALGESRRGASVRGRLWWRVRGGIWDLARVWRAANAITVVAWECWWWWFRDDGSRDSCPSWAACWPRRYCLRQEISRDWGVKMQGKVAELGARFARPLRLLLNIMALFVGPGGAKEV